MTTTTGLSSNINCHSALNSSLRANVLLCCVCRITDNKTNCLNLGSYNYLGFAENSGPCAEAAVEATLQYGAASCSPRKELGESGCMVVRP